MPEHLPDRNSFAILKKERCDAFLIAAGFCTDWPLYSFYSHMSYVHWEEHFSLCHGKKYYLGRHYCSQAGFLILCRRASLYEPLIGRNFVLICMYVAFFAKMLGTFCQAYHWQFAWQGQQPCAGKFEKLTHPIRTSPSVKTNRVYTYFGPGTLALVLFAVP